MKNRATGLAEVLESALRFCFPENAEDWIADFVRHTRVPSPSTLARCPLSIDAAWMVANRMRAEREASEMLRFGWADSSPQGTCC